VRGYLRKRCQRVFHILLPDLAENYREKFRNILRIELDKFELFKLVESAITKKRH